MMRGEGSSMGTARDADPVKLIASLLAGEPDLLERAALALCQAFGPMDLASGFLPFDHTSYYEAELGPGLQRQILSFGTLVAPHELPAIKRATNALEISLALGGCRRVNIDPGYVSLGKLVLASTKDHAHRLYLGQGVYGEVTLTYQRGQFRPWPWTYPDYASPPYCRLFEEIRKRYKAQLRQVADQHASDAAVR
jgi:hypothetical protein